MGILIVFIVMLVIGIILCKKRELFSFSEEIGIGLGALGALGLIVCAIILPLQQTICNYDKK